MHVLRQLEKPSFAPGNSLQSHMRIDSHFLATASDAPMPTARCLKSDRRKRLASQLADHTETVENRHLQIQEHNIGRISMDEVKGFTSVCHSATRCPEASKTSRISSRLARLSSATRIAISVHSGPAHFPEPYPSIALCESDIFSIDESWLSLPSAATESDRHIELPRRLEAQEKNIIEDALKGSSGRVFGPLGAAAKLGIPRSTLESKIKALKIDKNRFRTDAEN